MNKREWIYNDISDEKALALSKKAGISTLLAKVFLNRGMEDINYIRTFLSPSIKELHDPFLLKDMDIAVERVCRAIDSKEKIIVYGDYDVDGTTSTSILTDFLRKQAAEVDFYIPDRMDEGYGLSIGAIDKIIQSGASLIITVDCGITAVDEVKYIKEKHLDVIITDHHQCKDVLPEGDAVVNPCRPDCNYPFKQLAGVGVAYKLVHALCIKRGLGNYHNQYLDLVALGTVADVVPLVDENRVIVKYGLNTIENTTNVGLRALIDNSGLKDKPITSFGISFVMAPRINAAGRIGSAGRAVQLLTTNDPEEALRIALELNEENKFRQDTEMGILQEVMDKIQNEIDLQKEKVIVVSGHGWHHGIIGIVASKVTERYYRPCVLINNEDGIGKGSGRSIEGFNLFNALNYCQDLLEKFGGHELAAGLSLKTENIGEFRRRINQYADTALDTYYLVPKLKIDVNINKADISVDNIRELDLLAPFGAGNPGPVFAYNGLKISDMRTVGEGKHLKLKLEDEGFYVDAIGFNMSSVVDEFGRKPLVEVACTLEINVWNSTEKVQLNLKDIKQNPERVLENKYYMSLEQSLRLGDKKAEYEQAPSLQCFKHMQGEEELLSFIIEADQTGKRVILLSNTLKSIKILDKILKKSSLYLKKHFEICYTSSYDQQTSTVLAIVNPDPDKLNTEPCDSLIFFGPWIDKGCLYTLAGKAAAKDVYTWNWKEITSDIDAIVPDRQDLVAVYQYFKECTKNAGASAVGSNYIIDDLWDFSEKLSALYPIKMNCYKLRKCIGIFEELGLLRKSEVGQNGLSIALNTDVKGKANLESSKGYQELQLLKMQHNSLET